MTRIINIILSVLLVFGGTCQAVSAQDTGAGDILKEKCRHSLKDQGLEREYFLYIPENIRDTENIPLVFALHGYGGHAWNTFPGMMWTADRNGFAVCFPQGAIDPNGKPAWEVGYPFQSGNQTDDVKFLCRLAGKLQKEHGFRKDATFVTGMSNGGEMCYILAASASGTFRAFAPIAGLQMEWAYKELKQVKPVPLMEVHGTSDTTSYWDGDLKGEGGWGAYLPVEIAVGNWVAYDKCTDVEVTEPERLSPDGRKVILYRYTGGDNGTQVLLYKIIGAGHSYNTDSLDTAGEVWKFFSMYL